MVDRMTCRQDLNFPSKNKCWNLRERHPPRGQNATSKLTIEKSCFPTLLSCRLTVEFGAAQESAPKNPTANLGLILANPDWILRKRLLRKLESPHKYFR